MRMTQLTTAAAPLWLLLLGLTTGPLARGLVPPEITYPAGWDRNGNLIEDRLEADLAANRLAERIEVIVTLYGPPGDQDIARLAGLGGTLTHLYDSALYGFACTLPNDRVTQLATALAGRLCLIEANHRGQATMDDSARQARVRPLVWDEANGYNLRGDPSIAIAICDTGIDDTHPDLAGRVIYWQDFTDEAEPGCIDRHTHGSCVAGIAAGSGAALGNGTRDQLTTTISDCFWADGMPRFTMAKVPVVGDGTVSGDLLWDGNGTAWTDLATSNGTWLGSGLGSAPFIKDWTIAAADIYKVLIGNVAGLYGQPYSMLLTCPYEEVGDGFNQFTGIAPECALVGLKILHCDGTGWADDWIAAFDWIVENNRAYMIHVVNASVGLCHGMTNMALRTAANSVPRNGSLLVVAAGNDFPDHPIGDPGLAERALTVGAVSSLGAVTGYSSMGPPQGPIKPDVLAPGGSCSATDLVGAEITSCDTNVNDAGVDGFADRQPDDYTMMHGTSVAAPHVAGLAALLIQARGGWTMVEPDVLWLKRMILMTASETNHPRQQSPGGHPTLDRGAPDKIEGYGIINGDAAIETQQLEWNVQEEGDDTSLLLGGEPFGRRVWATYLTITGAEDLLWDVVLDVPDDADFDLYLYDTGMWNYGHPIINHSSTNAGSGLDEAIVDISAFHNGFEPFYLVVKQVSGSGEATLSITAHPERRPEADLRGGSMARLILGPSQPHRAGAGTLVPYEIRGGSPRQVSLKIYDLHGRLQRTVLEGSVPSGPGHVFWDGTDTQGLPVAVGVYVARLTAGDDMATRRILVMR